MAEQKIGYSFNLTYLLGSMGCLYLKLPKTEGDFLNTRNATEGRRT